MALRLQLDREDDGRFIAGVPALSGVWAYGATREEAIAKAKALALHVIADRIEHGEALPDELGGSDDGTFSKVEFIEPAAA